MKFAGHDIVVMIYHPRYSAHFIIEL